MKQKVFINLFVWFLFLAWFVETQYPYFLVGRLSKWSRYYRQETVAAASAAEDGTPANAASEGSHFDYVADFLDSLFQSFFFETFILFIILYFLIEIKMQMHFINL
jgi:hypothetical protein